MFAPTFRQNLEIAFISNNYFLSSELFEIIG
jgi:hypothetical protein